MWLSTRIEPLAERLRYVQTEAFERAAGLVQHRTVIVIALVFGIEASCDEPSEMRGRPPTYERDSQAKPAGGYVPPAHASATTAHNAPAPARLEPSAAGSAPVIVSIGGQETTWTGLAQITTAPTPPFLIGYLPDNPQDDDSLDLTCAVEPTGAPRTRVLLPAALNLLGRTVAGRRTFQFILRDCLELGFNTVQLSRHQGGASTDATNWATRKFRKDAATVTIKFNLPTDQNDDDGDGLTNEMERILGTDPHNCDTDGDGLTDGEEHFKYGTDPLSPNTSGIGTCTCPSPVPRCSGASRSPCAGDGCDGAKVKAGKSPLEGMPTKVQ